jgi:glycosyltransferase involved in cell wall biosynthesis
MKKSALYFFLAFCTFILSYLAAPHLSLKKDEPPEEISFSPANFVLKESPFTVVIIGYNNGGVVAKTLSSVLSQVYENFRLIYIDDCSDDGSFEVARDAVYASDHLAKVSLIRNEEKLGTLANVYRAAQSSSDDEILIILESDQSLAHEWVLQRLNAYYEDPNLWITLAQGINYPSFDLAPFDFKEGRELEGLSSHLKTFSAALFKKIHESDLVYSGFFLPAAVELAYMTPMLEMGKEHFTFIPEVLSINNKEVVKEEDRELVLRCEKYIRSLDPYPELTTLRSQSCGD